LTSSNQYRARWQLIEHHTYICRVYQAIVSSVLYIISAYYFSNIILKVHRLCLINLSTQTLPHNHFTSVVTNETIIIDDDILYAWHHILLSKWVIIIIYNRYNYYNSNSIYSIFILLNSFLDTRIWPSQTSSMLPEYSNMSFPYNHHLHISQQQKSSQIIGVLSRMFSVHDRVPSLEIFTVNRAQLAETPKYGCI